MSDYGIFESIDGSSSEKKIATRQTQRKLDAAIDDVKNQYGAFLFASRDAEEFGDRVALCKDDMIKTVNAHLMPVTGVMRRIVKACKDEWKQNAKTAREMGLPLNGHGWDAEMVKAWANRYAPNTPDPGGAHRKDRRNLDQRSVKDIQESSMLPRNPFPKSHRASSDAKELKPKGDWEAYLNSVDENSDDAVDNCFSKEGNYYYAADGAGAPPEGMSAPGAGAPALDPISQAPAVPVNVPAIQAARQFIAEGYQDTYNTVNDKKNKPVPGAPSPNPGRAPADSSKGDPTVPRVWNNGKLQYTEDVANSFAEADKASPRGSKGSHGTGPGTVANPDKATPQGPAAAAAAAGPAAGPRADNVSLVNNSKPLGQGGGNIGPGEYTIQKGDTYADIARRSGWGDDYKGMAKATGYQSGKEDSIFAGDKINVVAPGGTKTTSDGATPTVAHPGTGEGVMKAAPSNIPAPNPAAAPIVKQQSVSSLALNQYIDWCDSFGYRRASINNLDIYAANLNDRAYFEIASAITDPSSPIYVTAAPGAVGGNGAPAPQAQGTTNDQQLINNNPVSVVEPAMGAMIGGPSGGAKVTPLIPNLSAHMSSNMGGPGKSLRPPQGGGIPEKYNDNYYYTDPDQLKKEMADDERAGREGRKLTSNEEPEWDTEGLQRDFHVEGFSAPFVVVRRKSDGQRGSLEFNRGSGPDNPRRYKNFVPHHASLQRFAAPDYLQKADEALTNLLNQRAEEFQQTIAPLQQALQTVQQAEALQQAQNPLGVQPPAGTVNVLPGQGDSGGAGGGDPMAAAQALAGMGGGAPGGDPSMGGGMDPSMQMQARRRRANEERQFLDRDDYNAWRESQELQRAGDMDSAAALESKYNFGRNPLPGDENKHVDYDSNYYGDAWPITRIPENKWYVKHMLPEGEEEYKGKHRAEAKRGGQGKARGANRPIQADVAGDFDKWMKGRGPGAVQNVTDAQNFAEAQGYGAKGQNYLQNHTGPDALLDAAKPKKTPMGRGMKSGSRKDASFFTRKVAGWEWDDHLNGYLASKPNDFTCKCGAKHKVPSYSTCKCGKIWNSYVIGTGGDNHQASVEKFICREIPVRENVIVAQRKSADCKCWKGYERVPGTKPCAEGSCRKCDSHRKAMKLAEAPPPGSGWAALLDRRNKADKQRQNKGKRPSYDMPGTMRMITPGDDIIKYDEDEDGRTAGKVKRHNLSDPGPLGDGKDDKMPDIGDLGKQWYKHGPGGKWVANRRSR